MNRLLERTRHLRTRPLDMGWVGREVVAEWADRATRLIADTAIARRCDSVLVPALYCAEVVDSIIASGLSCVSYEINEDLSGRASELMALLERGQRALVWLHPFGLIRPLPEALRKAGAPIIHDCCHALQTVMHDPPTSLTSMNVSPSDTLIFSLRKGLARSSGGVRIQGVDRAQIEAVPGSPDDRWLDHLRSSALLADAMSGFLPSCVKGTILSHLPLLSETRDADIDYLRAQGISAWRWQRDIPGATTVRTPIAMQVSSRLFLVEVPRSSRTASGILPALQSRRLLPWPAIPPPSNSATRGPKDYRRPPQPDLHRQ